VLGICLGHQCIAVAFGVSVGPNANAMHGRASQVEHDATGLLAGLPSPFDAGRYHALAADEPAPDSKLVVSARLPDGLVMGLRHRTLPIEGVQFHPESVLTPQGFRILANLARQAGHVIDDAQVEALIADATRLI
jgi:para-aminobenzoate synthetase component 2